MIVFALLVIFLISCRPEDVSNTIVDAVNMAHEPISVITMVITTGHMVCDVASGICVGAASSNMLYKASRPIDIKNNCLAIICGGGIGNGGGTGNGGDTRNAGYCYITGLGLVIISRCGDCSDSNI